MPYFSPAQGAARPNSLRVSRERHVSNHVLVPEKSNSLPISNLTSGGAFRFAMHSGVLAHANTTLRASFHFRWSARAPVWTHHTKPAAMPATKIRTKGGVGRSSAKYLIPSLIISTPWATTMDILLRIEQILFQPEPGAPPLEAPLRALLLEAAETIATLRILVGIREEVELEDIEPRGSA